MKNPSYKGTLLKLLIAPLIFMGGAVCFEASAEEAPSKKLNTVSMNVTGDTRYISAYGVPRHAASALKKSGIKAQPYAFKMSAKPKAAAGPMSWKPGMFFGVSLDGVPIGQNVKGLWNDKPFWVTRGKDADRHGGVKRSDGVYVYVSIPKALISKDLSHVGYAADGFPIFVSKKNKFSSSYRLKEGRRDDPPNAPGGMHDGAYISDYTYIAGAGALDRCSGLKVKNKYYIYIITPEFPQVPLCWAGQADPSFRDGSDALAAQSGGQEDEGLGRSRRRMR